MCFSYGYLTLLVFTIFSHKTQARFCDGGHKCLPPKECCDQGCCYMYAPPTAPRPTTPTIDHVLNLFFINHWYFWCFVLAIVLALLCVCSLWKKRRQLCGWGSTGHNYHSEGDSTGSCYAPPQYSRCNSFHHAPPPYVEVTSKPDLYPLVFSYTSDGGKGGTNYLMVQYFRNYIVRPVGGSLSAASTVDSLSSSFIRSANEANTLVPPPYSRATSPDLSFSFNAIPRSSSQQACSMLDPSAGGGGNSVIYRPCSVPNSNMPSSIRLTGNSQPISESDSVEFQTYSLPIEATTCTATVTVNVNSNVTEQNAAELVTMDEQTRQDEAHRDLNQYRKALKMHKQHKDTSSSFESRESQIDYPKMNRSYLNSNTDSSVSSLVNLGSPASPPCPTSPTSEVREILEQIRQIQSEADHAFFDTLDDDTESLAQFTAAFKRQQKHQQQQQPGVHPSSNFGCSTFASTKDINVNVNNNNNNQSSGSSSSNNSSGSCVKKKLVVAKTNRNLYLPIASASSAAAATTTSNHHHQQRLLRNSMTSNCILSRNRGHKGWISRSAPTTPGTSLPVHFANDDSSPLLDEHDEDAEQNV